MKVTKCLMAVMAVLSGCAEARKSYQVKEAHKGMVPKVRATTYPFQDVYENFDDKVTVYYQGKMAAAWVWDQKMTENQNSLPDVYHLTLDIILKNSLYFSPVMSFPRMVYLEPIFEIKEFTFGYKFDLAYFWVYPTRKDLMCASSMFKLSERKHTSTLIMRF